MKKIKQKIISKTIINVNKKKINVRFKRKIKFKDMINHFNSNFNNVIFNNVIIKLSLK